MWEIFDHTGEGMALFYGDFFARDSKAGGAWMGNFVEQSYEFAARPVIYNVCNYQKPANGQTALISWDDVITLVPRVWPYPAWPVCQPALCHAFRHQHAT